MEVFKGTITFLFPAENLADANLIVEDVLKRGAVDMPYTTEWGYTVEQNTRNSNKDYRVNCHFCLSSTLHLQAMADGWIPSFYAGNHEILSPVCPSCTLKHLVFEDGEYVDSHV